MLDGISTKIFADGADLDGILGLAEDPMVEGFTTNSTLMWKAGLTDYADFAQRLLEQIRDKPIAFEVVAGRIADAGVDPRPIMRRSLEVMTAAPRSELIWAGPHDVLNLVQANDIGCHIIALPHDLLPKVKSLGDDLDQLSLEAVRMSHRNAAAAGFTL